MISTIKKLEQIAFYFLIFTLPWQTRIFLYSPDKNFSEWNSAFFYFTDSTIIFLFTAFFVGKIFLEQKNSLNKTRATEISGKKTNILVNAAALTFFFFAAISLFQISDYAIITYRFVKLLEFLFLFFYVKNNTYFYPFKNIAAIAVFSALTQAAIGDWQYHTQKNIGLSWLGESVLSPNISGVAKIETAGVKLIRAYGTLPHPNIFAAFLAVAVFFLYYLISEKRIWDKKSCRQNINFCFRCLISISLMFFLTYALFLSFSRSVISIFILLSLFFFWSNKKKESIKLLFFGFIFSVAVLFAVLSPEILSRARQTSLSDQSIDARRQYIKSAILMIKENPIFGAGYGNFTDKLRLAAKKLQNWEYQPVHNIYFLVASETGLSGLLSFLALLFFAVFYKIKENLKNQESFTVFLIFLLFLLVGFVDHFFLTTQQGAMMFWIILGILTGQKADKNIQQKNNLYNIRT